jgi:hypothetical protein
MLRVLQRACVESGVKIGDAFSDVVADEAHAFDAFDAAFGGLVSVPALEPGARYRLDVSLPPESDNNVDIAE